jgi:hypothetical protein
LSAKWTPRIAFLVSADLLAAKASSTKPVTRHIFTVSTFSCFSASTLCSWTRKWEKGDPTPLLGGGRLHTLAFSQILPIYQSYRPRSMYYSQLKKRGRFVYSYSCCCFFGWWGNAYLSCIVSGVESFCIISEARTRREVAGRALQAFHGRKRRESASRMRAASCQRSKRYFDSYN